MNIAIKKIRTDKYALLKEVIATKNISTLLQPIFNLEDNTVFGHEALCRGPENSEFYSPVSLFPAAEESGLLYPLENLARETAIRRFKEFQLATKLFINLSPRIINEPGFAKGQTRRLVKHLELQPSQIVFEITERSSIKDFAVFKKALEHYRQQGFLVAVDDAGAGYSSLQAIAELHPDFIKLDMSLIHEIDSNPTKKALLETFVTLASKINSSLIAEGIETASELQEIKKLGIGLGQGFFLAKPSIEPPYPEIAFTKLLNTSVNLTNKELSSIITPAPSISVNTRINDILDYFNKSNSAPALIVVDKSLPTGVVVREKFLQQVGSHNHNSILLNQSVVTIMDSNPIIAKSSFSLDIICQLITYRTDSTLRDMVIVTENSRVVGVIPINLLLWKFINQNIEKGRL